MSSSRIGYNCNAQAIGDVNRLKAHLTKINPVSLLIMDGLALANELHAMLPGCIVIHRPYSSYGGDDSLVGDPDKPDYRVAPEKWLDDRLAENAPMIWHYCGNEQGFSKKVINWYIRLIKYNATKVVPARLVIGNFSVGTPEASDWKEADELLKLCDRYRDWVILSLHEYACGVITSGLYGGWPNSAGVQPGTSGGKNLISRDSWPGNIANVTMFFMGRYRFLINYCTIAKIRPPRIIITETGMDDISAIQGWTNNLPKTAPFDKIRGYKTLQSYWRQVYPQWGLETAYFEGLKWADETIYKPLGIVEAELIFCWNQNAKWIDFDVSNATVFQKALEDYVAKSNTRPIPVVQPDPAPIIPPLVAPALPDDSTPLTIIPSVRQFTYTMQIQVTAETEVAAEKVAEFALANAKYGWQTFLEIAKLSSSPSQIKDANFVIELPQEEKS